MITWYVLFGMDVHQALKFPLQQILLSLKMVRSSGKPLRGSLSPSDNRSIFPPYLRIGRREKIKTLKL
ncbi:MAG: hypothetical protein BGP14_10420 [Sphingobacteriales bacterium 44-15]|nr:MAG: hypothetical protein BGP14_10420 [Sphingobacteriales bacterium 44-15]